MTEPFPDRGALVAALNDVDYLVDEGLATALFVSLSIGQPLLLEGEPGVGKTTAAKAMAQVLGSSFASSVTRASPPQRRCTNGTTPSSC
jgi:MoxR-like ATPase